MILYQAHIAMEQKTPKKLLIVDDEKDIQDFLKEFFEARGYSVVTAGEKEEAKNALLREKPHAVVLDIRMKGQRDGIDLLCWIREQKLQMKVIMATGVEDPGVVQEVMKLGADDYVTKPLSLEYLEGSVSKKLAELFKDSGAL